MQPMEAHHGLLWISLIYFSSKKNGEFSNNPHHKLPTELANQIFNYHELFQHYLRIHTISSLMTIVIEWQSITLVMLRFHTNNVVSNQVVKREYGKQCMSPQKCFFVTVYTWLNRSIFSQIRKYISYQYAIEQKTENNLIYHHPQMSPSETLKNNLSAVKFTRRDCFASQNCYNA